MHIHQIIKEIKRNRILGYGFLQNTFLFRIILLRLINHIHINIAVFLLGLRTGIEIFLKISQSFFVLLQIEGRYSCVIHHRSISVIFRQQFTTEQFQLRHIDISSSKIQCFGRLFLFRIVHCPVQQIRIQRSQSILGPSNILTVIRCLYNLHEIFVTIHQIIIHGRYVRSLIPLTFKKHILLVSTF